jgi:sirohydrochlorin cobaltochelatase
VTRPDLTDSLREWLVGGGIRQIGQVRLTPGEAGAWELCHHEDAGLDNLELFTRAEDARHLSTNDESGEFRPLKTAPNLRRGWRLVLPDFVAVRHALDYFYPAMAGVLRDHHAGRLAPVPLRETLGRQSGMYAITRKITDEQAQSMIGGFCTSRGGCLKTILWRISPEVPVSSLPPEKFDPAVNQTGASEPALPMLCHEACNLLVAKAREVVKGK